MTLHIVKLFVGLDTVSELASRQAKRLQERKRAGEPVELFHFTRHTPRRSAEILPGGSIYWIMKSRIVARQRLLEFRPVTREGIESCLFVFDKELILVEPVPRRPFQGWRYLESKDAPKDIGPWLKGAKLPSTIRQELASLGLL